MPIQMPQIPQIERLDIDILDADAAEKRLFASSLGFYRLFWVFLIGSFLGVVIETIWCFIMYQCFESRAGLVIGPFNPVYGTGAIVLTLGLHPLRKKRDAIILVAGGFLGGMVEYASSWIQQVSLGSTSWDYSDQRFNIGGRTSLLYMFFWGVLAIIWIKDIYPRLSKLITKIPMRLGTVLTWIFLLFMVADCGLSAGAVYRRAMRLEGVAPKTRADMFFDEVFPDERMDWIYPHMNFGVEKTVDNLPSS
ncbi:MAG: putative ABC transporter permease [Clostridia bacterium]|nr:putative ABC transporter permease [Clostridia bacterium]